MPRVKKPVVAPLDPLLSAIIAKLPPSPAGWSAEQRKAWLEMMSMAFDVVYGPVDGNAQYRREVIDGFEKQIPVLQDAIRDVAVKSPGHAGFDYYVDQTGNVCDSIDGLPVTAEAVGDEMVYDYRRGPARDRDKIIWADGSTGALPGMNFCGPG